MRTLTKAGLAVASVLALCLQAGAQPDCNPEVLWSFGGVPSASDIRGTNLLVATRPGGLQSVDVSDPSSPRLLDVLRPQNPPLQEIWCVDRAGEVACISEYSTGVNQFVSFIDLADPSSLGRLSTRSITGKAGPVSFDGRFAYVGAGPDGAYVIDAQNVESPQIIAHITLNYQDAYYVARLLERAGLLYLYEDEHSDHYLYDVSDPANPQLLKKFELPGASSFGQAMRDGVLYVAARYGPLNAVDISDPANPVVRGSATFNDAATGLWLEGNRLYLTQEFSGQGLVVFDVTSPFTPTQLGTYPLPDPASCVVLNGIVFACDRRSGVRVLDAIDPGTIVELGHLANVSSAYRIQARGSRLFVSGLTSGAWVVDPDRLGADPVVVRLEAVDSISGASGEGDLVCLADKDTFRTLDIGDPADPVFLAEVYQGSRIEDVLVFGNYAYLAGWFGLRVWDISDPVTPVQVFQNTLGGHRANRVAQEGNRLYVTTTAQELFGYDVTNPAAPAFLTKVTTDMAIYDMATEDHLVYLAGDELQVFDVTNPGQFQQIGELATGGLGVTVIGDAVALATGSTGSVVLIDVSNPTLPLEIGREFLSGHIRSIRALDTRHVLVGSFEGGVHVVRAACCPPDFNSDGVTDTRDVLAFLNAYVARDWRADFDANRTINTLDLLAFLNAWVTGCT